MNYLIIGNGPAGVIAAETLRQLDPAATVQLVGDEPEPPYSRMAIPYLLMGNIAEAGTYLRKDAGHFAAHGIETITARADHLDTGKKEVKLDSGRVLSYDRLLIACGSRPMTPPIPGMDLPGVYPCWTLADARAILARAQPGARVLQMGAGFIGCILMEALATRGVQLTVVEMGNRLVPRMLSETAGSLMKQWVESKGVDVYTSTRVEAIEPAGRGLQARLGDGRMLAADLVISATGVQPNLDWLSSSGLLTDTGIIVADTMQASVPEVFAAGDVAQTGELYTHNFIVNAIQPNAADQARIAAHNMAGREHHSQGAFAMNVLDALGLITASFGQWMGVPGGDHAERLDADRYRYLRLEFDGDVLVGANSLGLTQHIGVLRGLIQGRVPLGSWKERLQRDPTRIMEAYLARAHCQERRIGQTIRP